MTKRGWTGLPWLAGIWIVIGLLAVCVGSGCSAGDSDDDDDDGAGDDDYGDDDYGDDDTFDDDDAGDDDSGDDDDDTPPTPEDDVDPGTSPRSCGGSVYVINTDGHFVSKIDATTLDVDTIEVEAEPTILRATDDCTAMLTLNTGADSVTIIDVATGGTTHVDVRPGLNEMKISPTGRYAVAYHNFTGDEEGSQGYGEVSIVDIDAASVLSIAVGFPPDEVVFSGDGRAVLISETTLAVVGLATGSFSSVATGLDVDDGQVLKKVAVTAGGDYALLLAEASTALLALDLSTEELERVELECYPTDLDVAAEGDVSMMVCRDDGLIVVMDNETLALTTYETDETVGSCELTEAGDRGVLFTNAEAIERVHVIDTATGEMDTYLTVKPILGVAIAPHDTGAVLAHYGGDGEPIDDFDAYFDTVQAFSVMNMDDGRINPVETVAVPLVVSFGEDGRNAVIPFADSRQIVLVNVVTGLADVIVTPSTPLEVGVIADLGTAFVLQEHPLGRISFVDVDTLQFRTITGFLLNGGIDD